MAQYNYANPFADLQTGRNYAQGVIDQGAQQQAGNLLAQDPNTVAAAKPLFQIGQLEAGSKVQTYQADQQKQAVADHLAFLGKAADYLTQIPDDGSQSARKQALYKLTPQLQQMGYKPQDIQQLQGADLSDQALGVFRSQIKLQLEKVGNDIVGVNPNTGKSSVVYHGEDAAPKHDWKERINTDGSTTWIDLNDPKSAGVQVAAPEAAGGQPTANVGAGIDHLTGLGATVTSAYRTPQHNADVGGVANSQHLTGQAVDLTPPSGMTMVQLAAQAQQAMPGAKVINEGDHVHVQWGGGQAPTAAPAAGGGVPGSAPGTKGRNAKWDIYIDPKGNVPYRYNPATAEATTLDGKPYSPSGAAKMNGGGTPRSAAALAVQRYVQENPNATAEDISKFNANVAKERAGAVAFNNGKQGQTITAINTGINHLGTLGELATALDNGNIQLLNKAAIAWKTQTGDDAPTNFNGAKQLVAAEIVKAIAGSGGGVADREDAKSTINSASSPKQLAGMIRTYQKLLGGQLESQRLAYKNSTGLDDFDTHLLPGTKAALEPAAPAAAPKTNRPPLSAIFGR